MSKKKMNKLAKYYKCPRCGHVNHGIEDLLYILREKNVEISRLEGEIKALNDVVSFLRKSYVLLSERNLFDRIMNRNVIEI